MRQQLVKFWWEKDIAPDEVRERLVSTAHSLCEDNGWRRDSYYFYGSLYGGFNLSSLSSARSRFPGLEGLGQAPDLSYPLIREVVDAITSNVCSNEPKTMILPDGEIWKCRSTAKKLNKFLLGVRINDDVGAKLELQFKEAAIFGNGFLKVVPNGNRVSVEHVLPWEVCVDELDAIYGTPNIYYQSRALNRELAKSLFADDEATLRLIDSLPEADTARYGWATQNRPGSVMVFEAWKLPSSQGAKDGRHVLCFEQGTPITDEVWKYANPPLVNMAFERPLAGIWAHGVSATLYSYQLEMSRLQRQNYESMRLFGVPQVFLPGNSGINPETLDNTVGNIYRVTGDLPQYNIPPSMIQDYVQGVEMYRKRAFDHYGLNTAMATGTKPPGLNSGVAYQEYLDHNSIRLSPYSRVWEQCSVELDKRIVECVERMYQDGVDVQANSPDGRFLRSIKWSELKFEESQYSLVPFPTNILGATPAGKLDKLMTMTQMDWIDKRVAKSLLDLPDLEGWAALENAPLEYFNKLIEGALYDGETPDDPDEYCMPYLQDLGMPMVLQAIKRGEVDKAPDDHVELLREWLAKVEMLMTPPSPTPMNTPPTSLEMASPASGMPEGLPPPSPLPGEDMMPPEGQITPTQGVI